MTQALPGEVRATSPCGQGAYPKPFRARCVPQALSGEPSPFGRGACPKPFRARCMDDDYDDADDDVDDDDDGDDDDNGDRIRRTGV